jgi:teichuronic acid biosynthesis glycosyltransferase TuaG
MQHRISIVMPAYNADRYIAESINSACAQTHTDWELIVVDDGSTDDTAEVVRELAATDDRIKYVRQDNGGQASARNTGLRNASGDLVAFLDADDLWFPTKLELQVQALDANEADLVFSHGYIFSADRPPVDAEMFGTIPGKIEGAEMFKQLFRSNFIAALSVLTKRQVLEAAGFFDEAREFQNCEDYDLWLTLARRGAVFYAMAERLFLYRRHAEASTHDESNVLRPMLAVIKKHAAGNGIDRNEAELKIRNLYRNLIAALVREGKTAEARSRMKEFVGWDKGKLVTRTQAVLLRWWPSGFNFLSRECLFRLEWHLGRIAITRGEPGMQR